MQLGTLEELPQSYRDEMAKAGVLPLWPLLRNVLPHGKPKPVTKSNLWSFEELRPLLLKAGELTPVEKAERRVLILSDPGRGNDAMQATSAIYVGMQLLLPGEVAPAHRHTPSAARIIVEGEGAYTVVDGEQLPMEEGDVVLTPSGAWHDHGHSGTAPVIWLDALDLPLFVFLEGSYAEESDLQAKRNRPDRSQLEYAAAGLLPSRTRAGVTAPANPMMRYPWKRTEQALRSLARHTESDEAIELDYVNPETGESCLRVLGFTAMMLKSGATLKSPVRSSSAVFHVISGRGTTIVGGEPKKWGPKDTFSVPVFSELTHHAEEESFRSAFMMVHSRSGSVTMRSARARGLLGDQDSLSCSGSSDDPGYWGRGIVSGSADILRWPELRRARQGNGRGSRPRGALLFYQTGERLCAERCDHRLSTGYGELPLRDGTGDCDRRARFQGRPG